MSRLYEIDEQITALIDEETGEITNPKLFEQFQIEREEKLESIALWIKDLKAEAEALKTEKLAFGERQKRAEKKIESLKGLLSQALGGEKFKTTLVECSFRRSEEVQIENVHNLPEEYLRYKDPEPDKAALKAAIKEGKEIAGAALVSKLNLLIK